MIHKWEDIKNRETTAFLSGQTMRGMTYNSYDVPVSALRAEYIAKGVIVPGKTLTLDAAAKDAAKEEIADFYDKGAYADRGINVSGGFARKGGGQYDDDSN